MRFLSRIVLILTLVIPVLSWGNLDGKKELLEAFVAHSKFKGLIVYEQFRQSEGTVGWELDGMTDLGRDGRKYRLEYNGFFGDMARGISDGKNFLIDDLNQDVTLMVAPKSFIEVRPGSKAPDDGGLLLQAFAGKEAFDAFVGEGEVKTETLEDGVVFSFRHKLESDCRVFVSHNAILWIEYDVENSGFFGSGRQKIRDVVFSRFPNYRFAKDWFSTKPRDGVRVTDQRGS